MENCDPEVRRLEGTLSARTGWVWERLIKISASDGSHLSASKLVSGPSESSAGTCYNPRDMLHKSVWLSVLVLIFTKIILTIILIKVC